MGKIPNECRHGNPTDATAMTVIHLLESAAELIANDHGGAANRLASALTLLKAMPDHDDHFGEAPSRLTAWQKQRIATHISDHLAGLICYSDLAALAELSPGCFHRIFKESFGVTPSHYIAELRVARAQALMLNTNNGLAEIALMCGLSNQASLSNLFRRKVGMTPANWKKLRRFDEDC